MELRRLDSEPVAPSWNHRRATRDDDWLEAPLAALPRMNAHWAWFHVAEDEINHRGQIRWLRARLHDHAGGGDTV